MILGAQLILTRIVHDIKAFLVLCPPHHVGILFIDQLLHLLQVLEVILGHLIILDLLLNHPFELDILLDSLILPHDLLNLIYLH